MLSETSVWIRMSLHSRMCITTISSLTFGIANLSNRPYEPVLMHLPPYLKMEAEPNVLLKGKKGTVKLTLDAGMLKDYGLTQTSV